MDILSAAAVEFNQNGYAATSIDSIAARLGCTKGLLYYYYKAKIDLYLDVYRTALNMNLSTLEPISRQSRPASQRLKEMIEAQAMLDFEHSSFERISMQGVELHLRGSTTPKQRKALQELLEMRDRYEAMFIKVIDEGIKAREFHAYNPRFAAKPLLGALNWITVWYKPRRGETKEMRQSLAEQMSGFLLRAMRPG